MDTIENMIKTSMASTEQIHNQLCCHLLKSLVLLNERSGSSIDEEAIAKLLEVHQDSMANHLQALSLNLQKRVTDALQIRRRLDNTKVQKLVSIAKELMDACEDDENHTEMHFQTIGLHGNDLLVYKAIHSYDNAPFGISRTELETLFGHIPHDELLQIIGSLNDNGLCYTTCDPDHFMASHK